MNIFRCLFALSLLTQSTAFVPAAARAKLSLQTAKIEDSDDLFPTGEPGQYEGSVDWDEEWKKVVKNQNQPKERPGKDFYKSDAEIAAIRAANKAQERVVEVAKEMPSLPSWNQLKGDWKVRCCCRCV